MPPVDALKTAGNKYFKNGDYSRAIKYYKEGLVLEPGNTVLNCNLAQAYIAVKEFEEAEVHALVTLAHEPDSVKGHYRATKAALGLDKKERALSYVQTGLKNCPESQELRTLLEEITEESKRTSSSSTKRDSEGKQIEEMSETAHEENKGKNEKQTAVPGIGRPSRSEQNQVRSRSTSNRKRNSSKSSINVANARSISVNRVCDKNTKMACKNLTSKVTKDSQKDEFLDTLVKISSELSVEEKSPGLREREALMEKQKKLQTYMKEGSEALEIGLSKQASEKYKGALDIMAECNIEVFGLSEVDKIVLKYSLSICWVETKNYNNIVQSIGYFNEMESNYASKLPAVYYGLGRAFYRLNRFKVALNHLERGTDLIKNCVDITPYPWPGTMKTIAETTKVGLLESISCLQHKCRTYCDPDAICRYKECLKITSHICPSEIIFFSDPDFVGYVVIICQENCRITYHVGCWKHYKESLSSVKLSDKDVLGQVCLTSDCLNDRDEISLIVRIEVYGEDGKIKTFCAKEPTKTDNVNEHRKEKKKKNIEKIDKPIKIRKLNRVRRVAPCVSNSPRKVKKKNITVSQEFAICIQKLDALRSINFGFEEKSNWNPQLDYFGRSDIFNLGTFLDPYIYKDSAELREKKDFIFTYFYELINDEGPQKLSTVEKKWQEDISQFEDINEFLSQHDGICDFLLQSYRFACIDDYLCLVHHLTDTYKQVQEELGESITFILNHPHIGDETDDESLEMNKYVENLLDDSNENNFRPNHLGQEQIDFAVASTSGITHDKSVTALNQETSESSSDVEMNYDIEAVTDSEDEFLLDEKFTCDEDVKSEDNIETRIISEIRSDNAHCTNDFTLNGSENSNMSHEFQKIDLKNNLPILPDVPILSVNDQSCLVMKNVSVQIDGRSYLESNTEIENLKTENQLLKQEAEAWNKEKEELNLNFQKDLEEYRKKLHILESKLLDKEMCLNTSQYELEIRDSKLQIMKKEHHEEMTNLTRKKEEDTLLFKNNLENMTELNKEIERKASAIDRLEAQLRRSNEQILNLRKKLGECTLDCYLEKCKERLQCMNGFITLFEEIQSSSISDLKAATETWEVVARELCETRNLLQVQYDILSQQLRSKVSSDCLLQLELSDLPKEPIYPLRDVNNIIRLAVEYVQLKNSPANEDRIEMTVNNENSMEKAASTSSPFFDIPPHQSNGNLDNMKLPNAYEPSFFSNNCNTLSKSMKPLAGHHFNPYQSNQNINCTVAPPSEFHGATAMNIENVDQKLASHSLKNVMKSLKSFETILYGQLNTLTSNGQTKTQTSNEVPDKWGEPTPLMDLKLNDLVGERRGNVSKTQTSNQMPDKWGEPTPLMDLRLNDLVGERRCNVSSAAGLTPIESTKSGVSDVKEAELLNFKSEISELKLNTIFKKKWNYQKLLEELKKYFKFVPEAELSEFVSVIREKNGNKLTGLAIESIMRRVEKLLEDRSNKKVGNMGMDKFGGTAWGEVKGGDISWQSEDPDNECIICHISIEGNRTCLQCKHFFHTECIRKWLHTNSTCPICRKFTKLDDEFPPLG